MLVLHFTTAKRLQAWSAMLITYVCVVLFIVDITTGSNHVSFRTTTLPNNIAFFDKYIYVGALNEIFLLDENLNYITNVTTGPIDDNPLCIVQQGSCKDFTLKLTDNINKLLLVYKHQDIQFLISCGSIKNGICQARNLTTLVPIQGVGNEFVASVRKDESTAGVISNAPNGEKTLYVGSTIKERNKVIGLKLGTVTNRKLDLGRSLFKIIVVNNVEHRLVIKEDVRDSFSINYVSAFSNEEYTFFATVQPTAISSTEYQSKIVRICNQDSRFSSYTEIPLECNNGSVNYNILISSIHLKIGNETATLFGDASETEIFVGLFAVSNPNSKTPTKNYAICTYGLKKLNTKFDDNIEECLTQGKTKNSGLPWATAGDKDCLSISPSKPYCKLKTTFPIGGTISAIAKPSWSSKESLFHSIAAVSHPRGLTIYTGDSTGNIWKLKTIANGDHILYAKESVDDDSPVHTISINGFYFYTLTSEQAAKTPIKDCNQRMSCDACLAGPYCGWCSLENKCSEKADCSTSGLGFVDQSVDKCPVIQSTNDKQFSINILSNFSISTLNMPIGAKYFCSFNGTEVDAIQTSKDFSCEIPRANLIPGVSLNGVSSIVKVSLQAKGINEDVVAAEITLYNCAAIDSCLDCTGGQYKCDWCSSNLRCVDNANSSCEMGTQFIPYIGGLSNQTSTQCPVALKTKESYIPYGLSYAVVVQGSNLPTATSTYNYKCNVNIAGTDYIGEGKVENGTSVTCKKQEYIFGENVAQMTVNVRLLFGGQDLSPSPMKVTLFNCKHTRDDCSICADAPPLWKCGWCQAKQECSVVDACTGDSWTGRICPMPMISNVNPLSGSVGGNTTVVIEGRDLGTYFEDIHNITVAGSLCSMIRSSYVQSKNISCLTASVPKEIDGPVVVFVKGDNKKVLSGTSLNSFSYRQPIVSSFSPLKGPCSGGTVLTIKGMHLNVGRSIEVFVAGNPCIIDPSNRTSITASQIWCTTSAGQNCARKRRQSIGNGVVVSFDGYQVSGSGNETFSYQPDPTVTLIQTNKGSTPLTTFVSGGQAFKVEGSGFDLISSPHLLLTFPNNVKVPQLQKCTVISDTDMKCLSPNVTHVVGNANLTSAVIGLIMDNVTSALAFSPVVIAGDPVFFTFEQSDEGSKELKTGDMILEGVNLGLLSKDDVEVTIGSLPCIVTSLDQRLVCTAPSEEDVKAVKDGNIASVTVFVGKGGLRYDLGVIKYYKITKSPVPIMLYIGLSCGALVLVIIILILIWLYRKRHRKEKEYFKIYQTQMDNLESRYARECKEAFADLQTEITDLTTDLDGSVPYLPFDSYAMQVLFPGMEHLPFKQADCNKSDAWKRGMSSLCLLMKKEDFLLLFIRMLEGQQSFQMRDRCIVASLLMVILQSDLKYTTKILVELLADLIKKSVNSGRPKLLLRRTESVAEKLLTNWLAYTLHSYLEEYVGEPLFRLCAAIGSLLDKEPVDAITSDARNSLSEDKLLRQKVDFEVITISVEYLDHESVQVQVLNCDTISQCKEKILNVIYKNAPYTERPSRDHLELSWVQPSQSTVVLQDEDNTNQIDGEWKRLNTLQHYQVPDNCNFRLAAPQSAFACQIITGSPVMHNSSMPSVSYIPNHSSMSALHNGQDSSLRPWHLVKASDFPVEQNEDSRQSKMMAEVYLTRLLKTKGTLQNFVTELFDSIFVRGYNHVPPPVKFLFDFLDKQALINNITDDEVLHTWKNNSLPLRFWINVIKNPNFVLDIHKSSTVDSCLSVIAQLFMDSCSPDEHRLGKDSPSNKLLYAREIPEYKKRVARFYGDVKTMAPVTDEQMNTNCAFLSKKYGTMFNQYNAMSELLGYAVRYKVKLMDMLEFNDMKHYADELQEIMESLPDD